MPVIAGISCTFSSLFPLDLYDIFMIQIYTFSSDLDNKTKSFYVTRNHRVNWADGAEICKNYGMEYVTFDSKAEADYFNVRSPANAWIGLSDQDNEGEFVFTNGRDVEDLPWGFGQPSNYKGDENCVESRQKYFYGFNDAACTAVSQVACQLIEDVESEVLPEQDVEDVFEEIGQWSK
jgi:Lectin C-type domain